MTINEVFLSLENEAMMMLMESDKENFEVLLEQYCNATVIERRFSGSGFFTDYRVSGDMPRVRQKEKGPMRSVFGKINGLEIGVGFLLFLSEGLIDTLECHEYDSIDFPDVITGYELSYSTSVLEQKQGNSR